MLQLIHLGAQLVKPRSEALANAHKDNNGLTNGARPNAYKHNQLVATDNANAHKDKLSSLTEMDASNNSTACQDRLVEATDNAHAHSATTL